MAVIRQKGGKLTKPSEEVDESQRDVVAIRRKLRSFVVPGENMLKREREREDKLIRSKAQSEVTW